MKKIKKFIKNFYSKEQDGRTYFRRVHIVAASTFNGLLLATGSWIFVSLAVIFTAILIFLSYENDRLDMVQARQDAEELKWFKERVDRANEELEKNTKEIIELRKKLYGNKKDV